MKKIKNNFVPDAPPIRYTAKPDPDARPIKRKYKFQKGPNHNFWNLFKEEK